MGLFVRAFTRQNIVAIAVGVLVAGAPLVAFNFWLSGVIDRQGQAETESSAKRAVALAEQRVSQVVRPIDGLAAHGVGRLRAGPYRGHAAGRFRHPPIKEIAIIGP